MEHKVYREGFEQAIANDEVARYRESQNLNEECTRAIEKAIQESNHAPYRYDLPTASRKVLAEYGTERVVWVLSATLQTKEHDGRFGEDNKRWAKQTLLPRQYTPDGRSSQEVDMGVFHYAVGTHPAVLDGFVGVTRKIIAEQEHVGSREKRVDRSDR